MRRIVKIRIYSLLFAWFVIFAHSIIPHNHVNKVHGHCLGLIHEVCHEETDHELTLKFHEHHSGEKVCHISGFLFHHITADNLIFPDNGKSFFNIGSSKDTFESYISVSLVSDPCFGPSQLRAPPLA